MDEYNPRYDLEVREYIIAIQLSFFIGLFWIFFSIINSLVGKLF